VILSRTALAAILSTAAFVCAAPASAESPVFTAFATVCATPAADFAAVRAAADAHGWGDSDVGAEANMPGVAVGQKMSRAYRAGNVGLILTAWSGMKGNLKITDCAVHVAKADFNGVRADAESWVALTPQKATDKQVIYRFTQDAGAHRAVTSNAEFDAAAGAAGLQMLTISGDANGTVLDLMMIKK